MTYVYLKTKKDYQKSTRETEKKNCLQCRNSDITQLFAVTRIRTWVVAATTRSTNHYTITASTPRISRASTLEFKPNIQQYHCVALLIQH